MGYVVKEIKNGKFYMQLPDGKIVELKPGMEILPDSMVFGADTNSINAELVIEGGKHPIILRGFEVQVFDMSMFENLREAKSEHHETKHYQHAQTAHETQNATEHQGANQQNENPANMATAAGNNIHIATDFLNSEFESFNINFNEISPALNINIPIVTTGVNGLISLNETNIIREFVGVLNNDSGVVYESGLPYGTNPGGEPTVIHGNIFDNDAIIGGVNIASVNGIAPNAQGIITVTTPEGNIFELNANTGDYTFTLLHPLNDIVNGVNVDSLTQNFTVTLNDNFGHSANENVSITIIDDKPIILGDDVNISITGENTPQIIADIDITSNMVKTAAGILDNINPDTFSTLKSAILNNLGTIAQTIKSVVALDNENQDYINLLKQFEGKLVNYINNIEMLNAGDTITRVHTDGTTEDYTVKEGDILYHTDNGYLLLSNINTHYVDPEALGVIKNKLDNFLDNYSDVVPHANLIKTFADALLTPNGIDNLKTLIANDQFDVHIEVNGMHLDNGTLQINTIGVEADLGNQHFSQDVVLADTAHLQNTIQMQGKLFDAFGHTGILYGADLGHIESIKVGNVTYDFNPANPTQTIHTDNGDMHVNFITGDVTLDYNGNPNVATSLNIEQNVTVNVVDNDGDSVSKELTLQFGVDEKVPVLPSQIHDIDLGAGNDTLVPVDLAHMPEALKAVAGLLGITEIDKNIDFDNVTNVKNIEVINLTKVDNANLTNLSLDDVLNMTDNRNHLMIVGDNDTLNHVDTTGWSKVSEIHQNLPLDNQGHTAAGTTYIYTNGHDYVALSVNDQIDHTGL